MSTSLADAQGQLVPRGYVVFDLEIHEPAGYAAYRLDGQASIGERDQVAPGFVGYEGRRGLCSWRGEKFPQGSGPFSRLSLEQCHH
jgi:hypothetical protein